MLSQKSKVFITGATGFLGSYIVRKLIDEGFENVYCLKRNNARTELLRKYQQKINWLEGDILDTPMLMDILPEMEVVIHAAAMVSFYTAGKKKMMQTAKDGTANLVNISLENNIKKFIHISSVSALGRRREEETISEKNIFSHSHYDTTYGLTKFLAEQEVWRGHAEGLNVTILNPSIILGAGRWNENSTQIFKKVYDGLKFYPGGSTGWVDVRDMASVVHHCVINDYNGERYIISSENITYQKMFELIAKNIGVAPPRKLLGNRLASILWRFEALKSYFSNHIPIVTKETIRSMAAKSSYDNTKSISELGINYHSIEKTVTDCCKVFMESYPKGEKFEIL